MRFISSAFVASLLFAACVREPGSRSDDVTSNDNDESKLDAACAVAFVNDELNAHLLEEGLGSIYDIDEDGNAGADEDATKVWLDVSGTDSTASIGQMSFEALDGDRIELLPAEEDADRAYQEVRIADHDSESSYLVRVFAEQGIGIVRYDNPTEQQDGPEWLATLDCRKELQAVEVPELDAQDLSCTIASFSALRDYDGSIDSVYELDLEGWPNTDEDATKVWLEADEDETSAYLGQNSFYPSDGDSIAMSEETETEHPFIRYTVKPSEWDETFEVREFRDTGLGVVLISADAADGDLGQLAVLECRVEAPPVYEF